MNKESGLLGISGLSSIYVFWKSRHEGHEHAQLAIKTFVRRIARHLPDTQLHYVALDELYSPAESGDDTT
ncbi:hypothetical protein ACNKHX_19190 [Shigella flexneri]